MDDVEIDPLVGTTVANGRYHIQRLLGVGGMGAVYLARQVSMDRLVALKLIHAQTGTLGQGVARRFHQEMRVSAKIEHPNTIRVYDYGEADGRLYLAMEYLEGRSLRDIIQSDRPFALGRVVHIARQIAKALSAAHQEGVVHRDLKPENIILLDRYGEHDFVKILDFGIARSLEAGAERLTTAGGVVGTPAYMAPEQARGQAVDGRTDLYALGIMLYEMVTGAPPFRRPTTMSLLVAQMTEPPPPILQQAPNLAPGLAVLIGKLLAKDPEERPANAAEVLAALEPEHEEAPPIPVAAPVRAQAAFALDAASAAQPQATKLLVSEASPSPPSQPSSPPPPSALGAPRDESSVSLSHRSSTGAEISFTPPRIASKQSEVGSGRPSVASRISGWRSLVILLVLAAALGGAVAWRRHGLANRVLRGDSRPENQTRALSSARTTVNRKLQEWGEPLPGTVCQTKDERTISLLADALGAMRPTTGTQADPQKAIALLAGADSGSAERWAMLARAQFLAGDDAGTTDSVNRALELCPEYAAAYNLVGKTMQRMGRLDEAEAAFHRALTSDPEYLAPQFNLALLWLKKGDAAPAITMLTTLIERSPDTPHAFLARAQARLMVKDLTGAEVDLREATRRSPAEADAWLLLGQVLGRKGGKAEAHKALCRAKALGATLSNLTCER